MSLGGSSYGAGSLSCGLPPCRCGGSSSDGGPSTGPPPGPGGGAAARRGRRLVLGRALVDRHAPVSGRAVAGPCRRREREVLLHPNLRQHVRHPLQGLLAGIRIHPDVEETLVRGADIAVQPTSQLSARLVPGVLVRIEHLERYLMRGHAIRLPG